MGQVNLETLVIWIVVGGIAGFLASQVVHGTKFGLIGTVAIGIAGGFVGGWLFQQLGNIIGLDWIMNWVDQIIRAFVGAVILLFILRAVRH